MFLGYFPEKTRLLQGLLNCNNKNCKLRAFYIKPCASCKTSKNVIWYIRSHIACQSKNVFCSLKCSTIPHTNSKTNLPLSMLFASIWDRFLAQASVLLLCQYAAIFGRGEGADIFLQSGQFQNSQKFFRELTWSQ